MLFIDVFALAMALSATFVLPGPHKWTERGALINQWRVLVGFCGVNTIWWLALRSTNHADLLPPLQSLQPEQFLVVGLLCGYLAYQVGHNLRRYQLAPTTPRR